MTRLQQIDTNYSSGNMVIYYNGDILFHNNNKIHRLIGPAAIHANGYVVWVQYDNVHRPDGPAGILPTGERRYYVNGRCYSALEFFNLTGKS